MDLLRLTKEDHDVLDKTIEAFLLRVQADHLQGSID